MFVKNVIKGYWWKLWLNDIINLYSYIRYNLKVLIHLPHIPSTHSAYTNFHHPLLLDTISSLEENISKNENEKKTLEEDLEKEKHKTENLIHNVKELEAQRKKLFSAIEEWDTKSKKMREAYEEEFKQRTALESDVKAQHAKFEEIVSLFKETKKEVEEKNSTINSLQNKIEVYEHAQVA